jgi:opacity protein-like surface antigen
MTSGDPFGADEFADTSHTPRIPEPMVFDLVRPLGARQGELEFNTLVIVPLTSYHNRRPPVTDPFGITPLSVDRRKLEWAPEVEYAVRDGLAFEFELPFEGGHLEAYKFAGQYTFGTAFDGQLIHGVQGIVQPTVNLSEWDLTLLYLLGVRFDETWSVLAMMGGRTAAGTSEFDERSETLFNLTLFADVAQHMTLAVETNCARNLRGAATLLVMPQVHWEATDHFMLQLGVGAGLTVNEVIPALGMRVIYSW